MGVDGVAVSREVKCFVLMTEQWTVVVINSVVPPGLGVSVYVIYCNY